MIDKGLLNGLMQSVCRSGKMEMCMLFSNVKVRMDGKTSLDCR